MKRCTKCEAEYEATLENFRCDESRKDKLYPQCKMCEKEYRDSHKTERSVFSKKYNSDHKIERSALNKRYFATVDGYLRQAYHGMTRRCSEQQSYIEKEIKNKFNSPEHLISYVVEVLKVDPRGLDCHRIDNNGHYEKGNIEFLTRDGHLEAHRIIMEALCQS